MNDWPATIAGAAAQQRELAARVRLVPLSREPATVAGVDADYRLATVTGAAALFDIATLAPLDQALATGPIPFPYVPGYLAMREGPVILAALRRLSRTPDILLVDGHGIAHPHGCGLASTLGVVLGMPAIGCAKSLLVGECLEPGEERGSWSPLVLDGTTVGAAVRTRTGVKPVFVSPGHLITIDEAINIVLRCTPRYRTPEPLRAADRLARGAVAD